MSPQREERARAFTLQRPRRAATDVQRRDLGFQQELHAVHTALSVRPAELDREPGHIRLRLRRRRSARRRVPAARAEGGTGETDAANRREPVAERRGVGPSAAGRGRRRERSGRERSGRGRRRRKKRRRTTRGGRRGSRRARRRRRGVSRGRDAGRRHASRRGYVRGDSAGGLRRGRDAAAERRASRGCLLGVPDHPDQDRAALVLLALGVAARRGGRVAHRQDPRPAEQPQDAPRGTELDLHRGDGHHRVERVAATVVPAAVQTRPSGRVALPELFARRARDARVQLRARVVPRDAPHVPAPHVARLGRRRGDVPAADARPAERRRRLRGRERRRRRVRALAVLHRAAHRVRGVARARERQETAAGTASDRAPGAAEPIAPPARAGFAGAVPGHGPVGGGPRAVGGHISVRAQAAADHRAGSEADSRLHLDENSRAGRVVPSRPGEGRRARVLRAVPGRTGHAERGAGDGGVCAERRVRRTPQGTGGVRGERRRADLSGAAGARRVRRAERLALARALAVPVPRQAVGERARRADGGVRVRRAGSRRVSAGPPDAGRARRGGVRARRAGVRARGGRVVRGRRRDRDGDELLRFERARRSLFRRRRPGNDRARTRRPDEARGARTKRTRV